MSTVVHAVLPDGDVGFTGGGQLTISEVDGLPAVPITHCNASARSEPAWNLEVARYQSAM